MAFALPPLRQSIIYAPGSQGFLIIYAPAKRTPSTVWDESVIRHFVQRVAPVGGDGADGPDAAIILAPAATLQHETPATRKQAFKKLLFTSSQQGMKNCMPSMREN